MGRFGFGIIAIMAFIALLTGLCELLFHRALKCTRHARSVGEDGAGPPPRLFLCQPLPTTAQTLRQSAKPLRKPCRNAMPSGREKLAISFLRSGSREPNAGIPWRWDTMRHGAAGLLLAERLRQLRPASLFYRRQPPFLAIGDRIVAVYQRKDNDVQALYNVSDGGAFLKNHPCYPGDRQMSLVYNLFYGMVLVMYLLILGMSLNNPYKPVRDLGG